MMNITKIGAGLFGGFLLSIFAYGNYVEYQDNQKKLQQQEEIRIKIEQIKAEREKKLAAMSPEDRKNLLQAEEEKKKKQKDAEVLNQYSIILKDIASLEEKLKKYYAEYKDVEKIALIINKLNENISIYKNNITTKEENIFIQKNKETLSKAVILRRKLVASVFENKMIDNGFNLDISAEGKNLTTFKIKYIFMNKVTIYNINNNDATINMLKTAGFKKIVYTNGYTQTWEYDL